MSYGDFIKEHGVPASFSAGQAVFRQGAQDRSVYYIKTGLLKACYLSADGKERIKSFIRPDNTVGSLSAARSNQPCSFTLVALQNSDLIRIPLDRLIDATRDSQELANHAIQMLLDLAAKKEQREYSFLMNSAEQRYINFVKHESDLLNQITQNDLALYLGITPVALSRIKSRLSTTVPVE